MTGTWSVNRMAARAVAVHGGSDAAELLLMLDLVDESGSIKPDNTAVYTLGDPGPSSAKDPNPIGPKAFAEHGRRPAGMTTPAGLATLTPISEQPVSKPKKQRERKPPKPRKVSMCGTYGGYSKHRREKTAACDECITAAQQYRRDYMMRYRTDGREPPRRKKAVCGTTGGWSKHLREGTELCQACRDAKNTYWRVKRQELAASRPVPFGQRAPIADICGTAEGFAKHRRLKTAFCDPCRDAYELANPTVDDYPVERSA